MFLLRSRSAAGLALAMRRTPYWRTMHSEAERQPLNQPQQSTKDIILGLEVAGEQFYRKLAAEAPEPLDEVFSRLADEEHAHHEVLERAFEKGHIPVMHQSDIVNMAHNVFKSIEKDRSVSKEMKSMLEIYKAAREMEATNRDKYFELAEKETNPDAKKMWEFMAHEEHKHYKAMNEMVEFVTKAEVYYYW